MNPCIGIALELLQEHKYDSAIEVCYVGLRATHELDERLALMFLREVAAKKDKNAADLLLSIIKNQLK